MMLYLDDDSVHLKLVKLLQAVGHDVFIPPDAGRETVKDHVHLLRAIQAERVVLTRNYSDFEELHYLVTLSGGHHPGIILVRQDNDRRDMKPHEIAAAIANLIASGMPIRDELITLNHYR
jgi:hypothetical protein